MPRVTRVRERRESSSPRSLGRLIAEGTRLLPTLPYVMNGPSWTPLLFLR